MVSLLPRIRTAPDHRAAILPASDTERNLDPMCFWDLAVPGEGGIMHAKGIAMDYGKHIVREVGVCGGEAVIRGTRVTIRTLLASLAEGATLEEILRDFPTVTEEDIRAVIAFAAASAQEDLPVAKTPVVP